MRRSGRSIALVLAGSASAVLAGAAALIASGSAVAVDAADEPEWIRTAPAQFADLTVDTVAAQVALAPEARAPETRESVAELASQGVETLLAVARTPARRPRADASSYAFAERTPAERAAEPKFTLQVTPPTESPVERVAARVQPSVEFGDRPRLFVFAAGSGQAFGWNMLRSREGESRRAGWSAERIATIGDAQVGVGWRKGHIQASLALVDREISLQGVSRDERFMAFTLSVKPVAPKKPAPVRPAERS